MTANDECKKWSLLSACDIVPPWRTVSMHSFGLPWSCSLWRWCLPFFSTRSLLLWFLALVMSIPTMIKRCCSNLGLKRCALEVQKLSSQNSDVFGCGNSQPLVPLTLLTTILISVGIASFDSSFRWWVQGKCEWQYVNIRYMMLACSQVWMCVSGISHSFQKYSVRMRGTFWHILAGDADHVPVDSWDMGSSGACPSGDSFALLQHLHNFTQSP